MIPRIALLALVPSFLTAHPDPGTAPGTDVKTPVVTGNGEWTYEAVPGWGVLPDGKPIGPTHGSVLVGPDQKVYLSTDAEMAIIVWEPDGKFVKSIAPECQGFHAMDMREEKDPEEKIFLLYVTAPVKAPTEKRLVVAEYLTRANWVAVVGNFEMDFRDGEIRYKGVVEYADGAITPLMLEQVIHKCAGTVS